MRGEIEKMDQAIADSSSFIKKMKSKDLQQVAYEKTISDFWDTSDVLPRSLPVKIASYPSLESLNEEPETELTEAEYEYYDKKRARLMEKMAIANDVYMAHLQNFGQGDPKEKSQKFLFQFNELGHQLHRQFDIVAERLKLPFEQPLMTYPGCQLDFVKKKVFLKGLIFKKKGFCNKKKGFPCQMDSFLIPAKGFFTSCILK